jgi:NhaC family Na+:H+ antiporter
MVSGLYDLYNFTPWLVLPAVSILVLSFFRVSVKKNMVVSIAIAFALSHFVQGWPVGHLLKIMVTGYQLSDPKYAGMLSGGGIVSMVRVASIVCLSASFGGMFKGTGLLDGIEALFQKLEKKVGTYLSIILAALFTGMVSCNQTLSIVLTHQLCAPFVKDREQLALDLENTAVVISPLIPWSIACATILDTTGAPHEALVFAVYLALLPLWGLVRSRVRTNH